MRGNLGFAESLIRKPLIAAVIALIAAAPTPTVGQSQGAHVAILTPNSKDVDAQGWDLFVTAIRERGWVEGRNITFEVRRADGRLERLPELAAEIVKSRPDVIVGVTTPAVQAAREQTDSIPIVMRGVGDPVGTGFIASLARPGGNITGPSAQILEVQQKSLQLLKEVSPGISRVALFWTPDNASSRLAMESMRVVAPTLGIILEPTGVNTAEELESAIAALSRNRPDALFVHSTPVFQLNDAEIIGFALRERLPTFTGNARIARDGVLLSYAPDFVDEWRIAAEYVDSILRGAKPAELPVQQPIKFQFVINLKTARAIGIEIPPLLLTRADEVIE